MQKQARFYPSPLRTALDSFSIYVVISSVSSNLIVECFLIDYVMLRPLFSLYRGFTFYVQDILLPSHA